METLVAGTVEIVLSGVGETHSVPAGVGTTTDEIGAALATSIDASPDITQTMLLLI